ncbi:hypothetical protein DIPPA_60824 [Diplonema papillatum]|nr:hypothetical protein DIPPA_60824 [Diplonema papillatum]KAJ9457581.1 hypothetical protein DIPPA_60824 [Diplonema papillatum]KAJ9457582.1 hypothetical protein DIPPA_60824 [Diplonema papillatum]KAJ9457583.1 hypothetical protein DIPPA_60824 [Diplonema papillatum]
MLNGPYRDSGYGNELSSVRPFWHSSLNKPGKVQLPHSLSINLRDNEVRGKDRIAGVDRIRMHGLLRMTTRLTLSRAYRKLAVFVACRESSKRPALPKLVLTNLPARLGFRVRLLQRLCSNQVLARYWKRWQFWLSFVAYELRLLHETELARQDALDSITWEEVPKASRECWELDLRMKARHLFSLSRTESRAQRAQMVEKSVTRQLLGCMYSKWFGWCAAITYMRSAARLP